MNDYTNIIRGDFSGAAQRTVIDSEEDPARAARSIQLGQATGVAPEVIHGDLDNFDQGYKRQLTSALIDSDSHLRDYVMSSPMAAKVSNGDWGPLSTVSQAIQNMGPVSIMRKAIDAFTEEFSQHKSGDWLRRTEQEHEPTRNFLANNPEFRGIVEDLGFPIEFPGAVFSSGLKAILAGAQESFQQLGIEEGEAKRYARDIAGMAEYQLFQTPGKGTGVPKFGEALEAGRGAAPLLDTALTEAAALAKPYILAGEEPPLGLHPLIDKLHIDQSKRDLKALDDLLSESQKSATRELAPEEFERFVALRYPHVNIGIRAEAIAELYKNKMPTAEDGILGWIPDLANQMAVAVANGGDVRVPLSSWLAKVDPAIAKELHDFIRVRPEGVTKAEGEIAGKTAAMVEAYHGSPHDFEAFSMEKIGTGEGAQAYGHGLYFAERPDVAKSYADALQDRSLRLHDTNLIRNLKAKGMSDADIIARLEKNGNFYAEQEVAAYNRGVGGGLYKVRINAEKEHFLDWDKPLAEQTPHVQEAIKKLTANKEIARRLEGVDTERWGFAKGQDIYSAVGRGSTSGFFSGVGKVGREADVAASKALAEAGIPGIKYLDQGSRGRADVIASLERRIQVEKNFVEAYTEMKDQPKLDEAKAKQAELEQQLEATKGSHNFVLFDDSLIQITHKNDQALASTRAAAGLPIDYGTGPKEGWNWTPSKEPATMFYGDQSFTLKPLAESTVDQALKSISLEDLNLFLGEHTAAVASRISESAGNVPIYLVSNKLFAEMVGKNKGQIAFYSFDTAGKAQDHIVVPTSTFYNAAEFNRAILHESIHAATSRALEARPELAQDARSIIREIKEQFPDWEHYGLSDPHELLTEALSTKDFQEQLSKIKISEDLAQQLGMKNWQDKTIWQGIVEWVRKALGLDENIFSALEAVMRVTEEAAEERGALPEQTSRVTKGAEKQLDLPGMTRQEDRRIFDTITRWMNKAQYENYMERIAQRNGEDAALQAKRVEKQVRKEMTAEWKADAKVTREQVLSDLEQRPDVQALAFFRSGKLYGEETGKRPRIDPTTLTEEQRALFPERYQRRDGMNAEDVAQLLGFTSVDELAQRVRGLDDAVADGSLPTLLEKFATQETQRRMLAKHGDLEENILKEAQEHVWSNGQFGMLHEELLAAAEASKSEMPFTHGDFKSWARNKFSQLPSDSISVQRFHREAGRAGREYELAAEAEDWTGMFKAKQAQLLSGLLIKEAEKFEKLQARFERNMRTYSKAEVPGIAPQHLNYIHDIMTRIGEQVQRGPEHIAEGIELHGMGTLEDFYLYQNRLGLPEAFREYNVEYAPSMPVADFLFDQTYGRPEPRPVGRMPVDEFRAVADSIQSIIKNGREESKHIRAGEAQDLATLRGEMIEQLRTLGEKPIYHPEHAGPVGKARHFVSVINAGLLQMEALWDRLDRGDHNGLFSTAFGRPFADAGNNYSTLQRKYSKMLAEIDKFEKNAKEEVPHSPFTDPLTWDFEPQVRRMTRENLRTVILNMGNRSNFEKMAKGMKVSPQVIRAWVDRYALKEDWDYAQGLWNIFAEIKKAEDEMTFELSGTTIENLPIEPIQTPHGVYEGGYFPMRWDRTAGAGPKETIENLHFLRPMTSRGWEQKRTGYVGPVDLGLGTMTNEISRKLKDLAFRPVIIQASKLMLDKDLKSAMTRYYGKTYADLMQPYLKDMAGQAGMTAAHMQVLERVGENLRQNTIGVLVGWNPGTVIKHGLSAWSNSMAEVGIGPFLRAFGNSWLDPQRANWKFVMEGGKIGDLDWAGSAEVQRRMQHYEESLGGAQDIIMGKSTIRQKALQWGSRPVAISDMASTIPTWIAKYETVFRDLKDSMTIEKAHTEAVAEAERSVRDAHGSTAVTSRPAFMRGGTLSRGVTSLYGFFNHVYNRYYQMAWRTKEMMEKAGRGDPIKQDVADLGNRLMLYVIGPIIAEGVAELGLKKDEDWPTWLWHSATHTISGTVPILRDIVHAGLGGRDPSTGIWGASGKAMTDLARDFGAKKKTDPASVIKHGLTLFGMATGIGSATLAKWAAFLYNYNTRKEVPKDAGDLYRAFRRGTTKRYH